MSAKKRSRLSKLSRKEARKRAAALERAWRAGGFGELPYPTAQQVQESKWGANWRKWNKILRERNRKTTHKRTR